MFKRETRKIRKSAKALEKRAYKEIKKIVSPEIKELVNETASLGVTIDKCFFKVYFRIKANSEICVEADICKKRNNRLFKLKTWLKFNVKNYPKEVIAHSFSEVLLDFGFALLEPDGSGYLVYEVN